MKSRDNFISRNDNVEITEAEKDCIGVEKDEDRKQADFGKCGV